MSRRTIAAALKIAGSLLLVAHLTAVIAAPLSAPPAPRSVVQIYDALLPYIQAAYLNHGYRFFAPDPGPSSLIEYRAFRDDGGSTWGRIPDRESDWPRLLYHRRFMVTEFYGAVPETDVATREMLVTALAQQIMKEQNANRVELTYVRHRLSSRQEVLGRRRPDHPDTYERRSLGVFTLGSNATRPDDRGKSSSPDDDTAPDPTPPAASEALSVAPPPGGPSDPVAPNVDAAAE